jgi:transcriptional regulator with XRE-family HTH domain
VDNVLQSDAPVAARLRAAVGRQGWDLQQLAEAAGISRTTLYHLLEGHTSRPRGSTLHALAQVLQVPVDELLSAFPTESRLSPAAFDRATNPEVDAVARERPALFQGWCTDDWDELYSTFGTGGALNRQGVFIAAEGINRKRETVRRLHLVLDTHLRVVAEQLIDTLYRMVRPHSNLADSETLRALVADARERTDSATPEPQDAVAKMPSTTS